MTPREKFRRLTVSVVSKGAVCKRGLTSRSAKRFLLCSGQTWALVSLAFSPPILDSPEGQDTEHIDGGLGVPR